MKGWFSRLFAPTVVTRVTYMQPMTPEQQAHFDAAFQHMDKAFEEMRKITGIAQAASGEHEGGGE